MDKTYGAIDPLEEQSIRLTFDTQIAIGEYSDVIYLTDEEGLSEPLRIEYNVEALPPYDEPDEHKYPHNMSLCAQVLIANSQEPTAIYSTDDNDIVYAFYRNECVGSERVSFDAQANKSKVYLTVFGNDEMIGKPIRFQLWQASTGKTFDLTPSVNVLFAHGAVYNCGGEDPLILTTSGSETQTIELSAGWNWVSFYLDLRQYVAKMEKIMTVSDPWTEGDLFKNPATRHFSIYSDSLDRFVGDFDYLRYIYTYMVYCANGNTMRISGDPLPEDSMYVTLSGNGQWSALPCLFNQTTPLSEALADYYQNATPGDLIKARNRFATFTEDKRWEGNLTALRPGEGYFFRRLAPGTVDIAFHNQSNSASAPKKAKSQEPTANSLFTNPKASTNMTMIAKVEGLEDERMRGLEVFVNKEKAAVASPIDSLYFLTIQSNQLGELRFELDGETYVPVSGAIKYIADSHHGSVAAPILLRPADDDTGIYKIIENQHVVIIRNNEKYDVTGKKL